MLIRNLQFDSTSYYECNKAIADFLRSKGLTEISIDENMYVFKKTEQLKAALKIMPIHLKLIAKLGGDSGGR